MYLSELINQLKKYQEDYGDLKVMSSSDYGDHCHTEQLNEVAEIRVIDPIKSAYSSTGLAMPSDPEDVEPYNEDESEEILVLRYTWG